MKRRLSILILLCTLGARAEDVCFKNQTEFEAVKAQLPEILKKFPVFIAGEKFMASVASSLKFEGNQIRFFFDSSKMLAQPIQESIFICANSKDMKIHFANGVTETISVLSSTAVKIRNVLSIDLVSVSEFTRIATAIDLKVRPQNSVTSKAPLVQAVEGTAKQ